MIKRWNWMAKLRKLHPPQWALVTLVSWWCFSTCCVNAKLPGPQHISTLDTTQFSSVVTFVMTLVWFIRCHPITFLSHREDLLLFFPPLYLLKSSHWSEAKNLWVWVSPFCFLALFPWVKLNCMTIGWKYCQNAIGRHRTQMERNDKQAESAMFDVRRFRPAK